VVSTPRTLATTSVIGVGGSEPPSAMIRLPRKRLARTFRGPADIGMIGNLLDEIASGGVRSVAFAIPWGTVWMLPCYELALLTAAHLEQRGVTGIELTVVTPEEEPLQVFGPPAIDAMRELLAGRRHEGVSGLCLLGPGFAALEDAVTSVWFRSLRPAELGRPLACGPAAGRAARALG